MTITPGSPPKQRIVQQNAVISLHERGNALEQNAVSRSSPECWLIFFARSERNSEADSLIIRPRISTAVGWKDNLLRGQNIYLYCLLLLLVLLLLLAVINVLRTD